MGIIKKDNITTVTKQVDKKILDRALVDAAREVCNGEGGVTTYAHALAMRLWHTALYAESDKDSTTAAKVIMERINGKPTVLVEEEKEEMPSISFRVHSSDAEKVKAISERSDVEEEPNDRVVVDIDGEPTMEF